MTFGRANATDSLSPMPRLLLTQPASFVLAIGSLVALVATYTGLAMAFGDAGSVVSGWFVPDGVTLFSSALDNMHLSVEKIVDSHPAGAALAVLNASLVLIHPLAASVFNVAALSIAVAIHSKDRAHWVPGFVACTPYYLVSTPLPSKDILVLLLFSVAMHCYLSRHPLRLLSAVLVAAAMFFVRDGFSPMLTIAFVAIAASERLRIRLISLMLWTLALSAAFWLLFESILEGSFLYVRSIGIAEQGTTLEADSVPTVYGYFVRLLGNATNLAFRPVFFDTGGRFNVLSACYWISGLTLLYALYCCAKGIVSRNIVDQRCGAIGILCLLMVSITPYVQPRYLLPLCLMIPVFSFTSTRHMAKGIAAVTAFSIIAALAYIQSGNYPPLTEPLFFSLLRSN